MTARDGHQLLAHFRQQRPFEGSANSTGRRNTPICEVLYVWSKYELEEKQARFWVLMAQGSTLTAACDAVGVNRRTGRRWRQATGGRIPLPEAERSGRYLSLEERLRIVNLHVTGTGVRAIAVLVGRSAVSATVRN